MILKLRTFCLLSVGVMCAACAIIITIQDYYLARLSFHVLVKIGTLAFMGLIAALGIFIFDKWERSS